MRKKNAGRKNKMARCRRASGVFPIEHVPRRPHEERREQTRIEELPQECDDGAESEQHGISPPSMSEVLLQAEDGQEAEEEHRHETASLSRETDQERGEAQETSEDDPEDRFHPCSGNREDAEEEPSAHQ
jgi:hypothetical protein